MLLRYIAKIVKKLFFEIAIPYAWVITIVKFKCNGVKFYTDFITMGVPIINVNLKGKLSIGKRFVMHSGKYYNMIGRQQPCYFIVGRGAILSIGDNVGISCAAIVCGKKVTIGNNVRIGGGTVIYDNDFHSLNADERNSVPEVTTNIQYAPVEIKENAFIGAHAIILKGVTIGRNAIIGAGSVVVKSVPDNEIWGGNPAKFIKTLD